MIDYKEHYQNFSNPVFWKIKALELEKATNAIWNAIIKDIQSLPEQNEDIIKFENWDNYGISPPMLNVFLMLAGFSIENLIKGMIILEHPEYIGDGRFNDNKVLPSHDLIFLAKHVDIVLNPTEMKFCEKLYDNMVFYGRYPIPKNTSKVKHERGSEAIDPKTTFDALFRDFL